MKNLVSKWMTFLLTVDQNLFRRTNFLQRFVIIDESWIYHTTPQSNRAYSQSFKTALVKHVFNEEVFAETWAYFVSKDKLFFKKVNKYLHILNVFNKDVHRKLGTNTRKNKIIEKLIISRPLKINFYIQFQYNMKTL